MANSPIEQLKLMNRQMEELQAMQAEILHDGAFKHKIEKLEEAKRILDEAGVSNDDIAAFFEIDARPLTAALGSGSKTKSGGKRRTAAERTWKNPHTGETYTGRRIAGKAKEWADEYGRAELDKWIV